MENLKVFVFTFFAVMLLLVFDVNGQLQEPRPLPLPLPLPLPQRPLCVSQLALVNYACGTLLPAPPATSLPSATAALPADDDNNHGHGHRHRNGHRHRHRNGHRLGGRHGHSNGGLEENCCRWLSDVDPECVCELLVRLPPFLSKQHHEYTVKIDDTCSVSYSC